VYAGVQAADDGVGPVRADCGTAVEGVWPSAMTFGTWIKQATRDAGKATRGLSSAERTVRAAQILALAKRPQRYGVGMICL
jgi:hypothetical protein